MQGNHRPHAKFDAPAPKGFRAAFPAPAALSFAVVLTLCLVHAAPAHAQCSGDGTPESTCNGVDPDGVVVVGPITDPDTGILTVSPVTIEVLANAQVSGLAAVQQSIRSILDDPATDPLGQFTIDVGQGALVNGIAPGGFGTGTIQIIGPGSGTITNAGTIEGTISFDAGLGSLANGFGFIDARVVNTSTGIINGDFAGSYCQIWCLTS
jgi:hypothetical protein